MALTLLRPPPAQGPFGRDFEAYYAAGATWNAGGDPWSRDVWRIERTIPGVDANREELLPYVGPAAALPLFGLFARMPYAVAVRWWTALLALGLLALAAAALRLAGGGAPVTIVAALTFAAIAAPSVSAIALGQAAMLSAGGIAVALLAYQRRYAAGAIAATLAAAMQPNLALGLTWRMRDLFALLCAAGSALLFAAVTLIAGGGPAGFSAYLQRLRQHGNAEAFSGIQHTPESIAWALGEPQAAAAAIGVAVAVATVAAVLVLIVTRRLNALDGTLLGLAALPLAVPFFHEHDLVVEVIPLLILALRAAGTARAVAGVAAVLILVDWFGLAQRGAAQPQLLAQGVAIALAFAACRRDRAPGAADLAPLAALAVVACSAIPLANAAPAPIWPDALPPAYQAPADGGASAVWADEQRAAGLLVPQPAWGALRALPLAGCVVLGAAIVLGARRR
ncbi:MAG TPA: glycosyltransferase 87 family protein [Candidatus Elarobacter sp.]